VASGRDATGLEQRQAARKSDAFRIPGITGIVERDQLANRLLLSLVDGPAT
jgi:hypothetical protein